MVQMMLFLLLSFTLTLASFGPAVRIDHQYLPNHRCCNTAMAIGPGAPSSQPIYVAFQDDSTIFAVRADIMFQKSTDGGRTWLPTDLLIRRGAPRAESPDITTDSDGNVYIVYENVYRDTAGAYDHQVLCTRSSDGGATWSSPARIDDESVRYVGMISIAADSAGNLFCAWSDWRTGYSHIWSSVSTDRGATWSRNVQVDDDTTDYDCAHAEVFVQPGTNHYLVAATTFRREGGHSKVHAYLYRSIDHGQAFGPGVQLDTFAWGRHPHVVADRDHIICDYFGEWRVDDRIFVEARTFYTQADSWGTPAPMTNLDPDHEPYYSGPLALSGDGRVHTALMVDDTARSYDIYYASSSDHGVSWSDIEPVYEDTILNNWYPDIVADAAGYAYVVWQHGSGDGEIWFSTNAPAGIAEETPHRLTGAAEANAATIVRGVLFLAELPSSSASTSSLFDTGGREVLDLAPGANDVSKLAPGVYFVRAVSRELSTVSCQKVVVTR